MIIFLFFKLGFGLNHLPYLASLEILL